MKKPIKIIIALAVPAILENTTVEARRALVKLWKPFFRREDITAVVTVLGKLMKGKLFLLHL